MKRSFARSPFGPQEKRTQSSIIDDDGEEGPSYLDLRGVEVPESRASRPLQLAPNLLVIVEKFNPLYRVAFEFLMSIAEPLNRSAYVHEYRITQMSLYTAMVLQYEAADIVAVLDLLSKNRVPSTVEAYVRKHTANAGRARFYLRERAYWLELEEGVCAMVLREVDRLQAALKAPGVLVEVEPEEAHEEEPRAGLRHLSSQLEGVITHEQLQAMGREVDRIQNSD